MHFMLEKFGAPFPLKIFGQHIDKSHLQQKTIQDKAMKFGMYMQNLVVNIIGSLKRLNSSLKLLIVAMLMLL